MKKNLTALTALLALQCSLFISSTAAQHLVGGDISMLTKYEEKGAKYLDHDGKPISDVLTFMHDQGLNAMRLRLFVDPSEASQEHKNQGVIQDLDYVKALGKRIKDAGMDFLLDLHYSDTWTDPAKHATPASWTGTTKEALGTQLYDYTVSVLTELKNNGAEPDAVQVGNEVTYGQLWPTGRVYPAGGAPAGGSWDALAHYIKRGVDACHAVCPQAKVVIHVEMSRNGGNVMPFLLHLAPYNIDFDIIGLSYYPHYHGSLAVLNTLLSNLESSYPTKTIQLVETGYYHAWYPSDADFDYTGTYPATEEGQRRFTADLITTLNKHGMVNGLYWWWPETCEYGVNWQNAVTPSGWYNAGLWDNDNGRVLNALFELKAFRNGDTGITSPVNDNRSYAGKVYDLQGRPLPEGQQSASPVIIRDGKKHIR